MCGIVGVVSIAGSKEYLARKEWMTRALMVDTLRGEDGTGICGIPVDPKKENLIYKKALPGYDFIHLPIPKVFLTNIDHYKVVIGHNRKATRGGIDGKSSHPFVHEHITLVHNGTLVSRNGVASAFDYPVDSEAVCKAIAEQGAEKLIPQLHGAYALVWYDSLAETFNMARNNERPLHFAFSEDGKHMFYASEGWMIRHLVPNTIDIKSIFSLEPGKHVIIKDDLEDLRNYEVKEFEIYKPPVYVYKWDKHSQYEESNKKLNRKMRKISVLGYKYNQRVQFSYVYFQPYNVNTPYMGAVHGLIDEPNNTTGDMIIGHGVNDNLFKFAKGKNYTGAIVDVIQQNNSVTLVLTDVKELLRLPPAHEPEDVNLTHVVMGPQGKMITAQEFDKLTKKGCAYCQTNIFAEDADDILWTADKQPICLECVTTQCNHGV